MNSLPQNDMPRKQCGGSCKQILPATLEFFSRNHKTKDGLCRMCKPCTSEYYKQYRQKNREKELERNRQYHQENKNKISDHRKQYYQANREKELDRQKQYRQNNKEKTSNRHKVYYQKNKGEISNHRKQYRRANKENFLEYYKQYRQNNREMILEHQRQYHKTEKWHLINRIHRHKRRAQKKASGGSYTSAQIRDQLKRQKSKCYWCHDKFEKKEGRHVYHIDHVVPLSRGGSNGIDNIVLACPTCNLRKNDKMPHEWPEGGRLF